MSQRRYSKPNDAALESGHSEGATSGPLGGNWGAGGSKGLYRAVDSPVFKVVDILHPSKDLGR